MAPIQSQKSLLVSLTILVLSTLFISWRYYKSAAFERPFHFSTLALLFAGIALSVLGHLSQPRAARYDPVHKLNGFVGSKPLVGIVCRLGNNLGFFSSAQRRSWLILLVSIVVRTLLFWRTIRTIHCSWDGLQTFLPFLLSVFEAIDQRHVLPKNAHDISDRNKTSLVSRYGLLALVWGISATDTFWATECRTGAICPIGVWERMIPFVQLVTVIFDAFIISRVGKLRRDYEDKKRSCYVLGTVFLASAGVLAFMAFWTFFSRDNFRWNVILDPVALRMVVLDSFAVAIALVTGAYTLGSFQPSSVALAVTGTTILAHIELKIRDGTMVRAWSNVWGLATGIAIFWGAGALLQTATSLSGQFPSSDIPYYKSRFSIFSIIAFMLAVLQMKLLQTHKMSQPDAINHLIVDAHSVSEKWMTGAKRSRTLHEAVAEYRIRYGVPPPPNFDKWYEYAVSVDSPVIDDFGQIHSDLLPFWGTLPALIRERSVHLLKHPKLSIGGLIIENGKATLSPHIQGTHRWMMDNMVKMVEPFAQYLPDMQVAFNLDDECRVSPPFDRLQSYITTGYVSRARLASQTNLVSAFSNELHPSWEKDYLDESINLWGDDSMWFSSWFKSPIFYEWISSTCPPESPVHQFHWWNKKELCTSCSAPHMPDGVMSDWTLSGDLCHQPDLAYLHGFLTSPSALTASHTLFPIFSQSRAHNFADILHPSPWNFGDKVLYEDGKSIPWDDKLNSVYWRGASSDGFASNGAWQTFLRARFVHMSLKAGSVLRSGSQILSNYFRKARPHQSTSLMSDETIAINVSFVGGFGRCDERDCALEHAQFYGSPTAEHPPSLDFQEHWYHKHLIDLDGAAFSGRFLPFLSSQSLPYRAALFRTWWEERVHPWRHFVPLDLRLDELWDLIRYFGGGGGKQGETIALEGREWAAKALRKEDMRVYMFRLLLEWGRIIDDRREELGFTVK